MSTSPRAGLGYALGAFGLWGVFPLFFPLLEPATPLEIVAHRVVWSLLFCAVLVAVARSWGELLAVLRDRRMLGWLTLASVLLATNWLVFVFAVLAGHTVDASLGYYINPIVTVALAVLVLGERLRTAQWVALGFGAGAVVVISIGYGTVPWIALALAGSFALYGLMKNRVGRTVGATTGLAVETLVLTPVALGYLVWLHASGAGTFGAHGGGHSALLATLGIATAVPLLCFAAATRRLPLSVVGLVQYLTPTMQLLVAVLVFHEAMPAARWWGFALVWVALALLGVDGWRTARRAHRLQRRTDLDGPPA
ncbi:MAG: EamA family transporter RarD [Actinomycetales bacterium]|nr:EamA family transporter RarD [Actinomycetales bacterium]